MPEIKPTLKLRGSDHQRLRAAAELVLRAGDRRTSEILLSLAFAVEHLVPRDLVADLPTPTRPPPPVLDLDDETAINLEDPDEETVIALMRRVIPEPDPSVFDEPDELLGRTPTPRMRPITGSGHIRNLMPKEPSGPTRVGLGSGIRRPTGR